MIVNDLRFAARLWMKHPGTAAVALLSLTLGIGANAAVFTFVKELFLPRLPVRGASQLVMIYGTATSRSGDVSQSPSSSYPNARDIQTRNTVFSGLSIVIDMTAQLDGAGARRAVSTHLVSGNYFSVLGVDAAVGRTLTADDEARSSALPAAVLGHALWTTMFGADASAVGRTIRLNDRVFVVAGVAPAAFHDVGALGTADIWIPITAHDGLLTGNLAEWFTLRAARVATMVARLKPGVSPAAAQASLAILGDRLAAEFPAENAGRNIVPVPLADTIVPAAERRTYAMAGTLMSGVVALVLLVACANVANLLLSRAMQRRREFSVRLALGASRRRLASQLFTESVLLSLVAGVLATLFVFWCRDALLAYVPRSLRPNLDFAVDGRVLLFTAVVALAATILFGLAPAWQASQSDAAATLDHVTMPLRSRGWFDFSGGGVAAQIALSYVALAVAMLFVRSLLKAQAADLGFDVTRAVVINVELPSGQDDASWPPLFTTLLDRVRALPAVERASFADSAPLQGGFRRTTFTAASDPSNPASGRLNTTFAVAPEFFASAGMRLERGRDFTEHDDRDGQMVAIVNDTAARLMWPGENPIGQRLRFLLQTWDVAVVGVVNTATLRTLGEPPQPVVYFPLRQHPARRVALHVRARSDAAATAADVVRTVTAVDSRLTPTRVRVGDEIVADILAGRRIGARLLSIFGGLALLLAAIGVYGVASYRVTLRTREIAIRRALGATRTRVVRLVVAETAGEVAAGLAVGVLVAAVAAGRLGDLLFGVSRLDGPSFAIAAMVMLMAPAAGCLLAVRRAIHLDPMEALRIG